MKNFKKLNRLFESVENPQMSPEIAACGLSDFMSKLDTCCMDNPELQSKVDSLKTMIGQVCMEPMVTAAFTSAPMEPAAAPMEPTSPEDSSMSMPADAVPTFGEFTEQPNQEDNWNVPSFGV